MKLVSWNVNGLRAAVKKGFEDVFAAFDADVFCVQETKLQAGQIDLEFPGFESYWSYAQKAGYSGTAVWSRRRPLRVLHGLGNDYLDTEGRICALEFPEFWLVNVYVPNAQPELARIDHRMQWEDAFREFCQGLEQGVLPEGEAVCLEVPGALAAAAPDDGGAQAAEPASGAKEADGCATALPPLRPKPVVMCGDFNVAHQEIDLKNPGPNRGNAGFSDEERGKFTELLGAGFIDTFRSLHPDTTGAYSWWSYRARARENNTGWRIDYFLTSGALRDQVQSASIYPEVMGSDHCPIGLELEL